jgi:hypothetical protein
MTDTLQCTRCGTFVRYVNVPFFIVAYVLFVLYTMILLINGASQYSNPYTCPSGSAYYNEYICRNSTNYFYRTYDDGRKQQGLVMLIASMLQLVVLMTLSGVMCYTRL